MEPIKIPATSSKLTTIVSGGEEYIYLYPDLFRVVSKGVVRDTGEDGDTPGERVCDYDMSMPKSKITLIEFGYHAKRETYQVVIGVPGDAHTLICPNREFAKKLYLDVQTWYLQG